MPMAGLALPAIIRDSETGQVNWSNVITGGLTACVIAAGTSLISLNNKVAELAVVSAQRGQYIEQIPAALERLRYQEKAVDALVTGNAKQAEYANAARGRGCFAHDSALLHEVVGLLEDLAVADVKLALDAAHQVVTGFALLAVAFQRIDAELFVHLFGMDDDGALDAGGHVCNLLERFKRFHVVSFRRKNGAG